MVDAGKNPGGDTHCHGQLPQEYPAVKTTIVGGRPPGCGKALGPIPRGIEVLVKKAAVDPEFKLLLMRECAKAAAEIGLVLDEAEKTMLNLIPAPQLEAIIARTTVDPRVKPAFLGRAAAVMLVALGATAVKLTSADPTVSWTGIRSLQTLSAPTTTATSSAPTTQDRKPMTPMDVGGMMADLPATSPASEPATAPAPVVEPMPGVSAGVRAPGPGPLQPPMMRSAGIAGILVGALPATPPASARASEPATATQASQPATAPAVTREQIMPLVRDFDSATFKVRQDAQEKLEAMGVGALQPLREILKSETLSLEVVTRIKAAMWRLKATTRPALLNPQPAQPQEVFNMKGMRAAPPPQPAENPED